MDTRQQEFPIDLGPKTTPHPAPYTSSIIALLYDVVPNEGVFLDPFGGIGGITTYIPNIIAGELMAKWAIRGCQLQHDALRLPFATNSLDGIVTSPTYGNRMGDHGDYNIDSDRRSYQSFYGEDLPNTNTGRYNWGAQYQLLHTLAWIECTRVVKPGGLFYLNISDHIRNGQVIPVSDWHIETLKSLMWEQVGTFRIETPRFKKGANHEARVDHESLIIFRLL